MAGRRVPGPAAPRSWLMGSRHVPEGHSVYKRNNGVLVDGEDRWVLYGFSRMTAARDSLPAELSLTHQTLKTLTARWNVLLEYEQYHLAALAPALKELVLSYLSVYGPKQGVDINTLKLLFLTAAELPGATGSDGVKMLDLSGLISPTLYVSEVNRFFGVRPPSDPSEALQQLSLFDLSSSRPPSPLPKSNVAGKETATVADSWEDEEDATITPSPSTFFRPTRFPHLTHLSLSHPHPSAASWSHLLNLANHLGTLTHLSLAYWSSPTLTPNAKTSQMTSKHGGNISLGGTHFYSALDNDWHEAASILRRLSKSTYSLQWLDLEGCAGWIPALTFGLPTIPAELGQRRTGNCRFRAGQSSGGSAEWNGREHEPTTSGPDWNGSWGQVRYVNISQGVLPSNPRDVQAQPAGVISCELLLYMRHGQQKADADLENPASSSRVEALGDGGKGRVGAMRWIEHEAEARKVAGTVRAHRRAAGGVWCTFDHGWAAPGGFSSALGAKKPAGQAQ